MAFKFNRSSKEPMSEINVTPFVDVMKAKNLELMNYSEKMMMMVWKLAKMLAVMTVNTREMAEA